MPPYTNFTIVIMANSTRMHEKLADAAWYCIPSNRIQQKQNLQVSILSVIWWRVLLHAEREIVFLKISYTHVRTCCRLLHCYAHTREANNPSNFYHTAKILQEINPLVPSQPVTSSITIIISPSFVLRNPHMSNHGSQQMLQYHLFSFRVQNSSILGLLQGRACKLENKFQKLKYACCRKTVAVSWLA